MLFNAAMLFLHGFPVDARLVGHTVTVEEWPALVTVEAQPKLSISAAANV